MNVMCISPIDCVAFDCTPDAPQVGDIDTVIKAVNRYGRRFYALERFGDGEGFCATCFATLPDSTADDMQEVEKEAIVNLETVLA